MEIRSSGGVGLEGSIFSRRHVGFKALVKRRDGLWEMKTRKAEYSG
jgi:hypothetical protein